MRWKLANGKEIWKNDRKYEMDWAKPSPSKEAQVVKDFFRDHYKNLIWYEEYTLPSTRLRVDFLCATKKIAIEYDGGLHFNYNPFFHKGNRINYLRSLGRDSKKEEFLERNGYKVIHLFKEDLIKLSPQWMRENFGF